MQQALALSLSQDEKSVKMPDISSMTEEEQLNYALQMSMASSATTSAQAEKQTVDAEMKESTGEDDYTKTMNDPEFLQSVLRSLPGVDPNSDAIRSVIDNLPKDNKDKNKEKDKEEKK